MVKVFYPDDIERATPIVGFVDNKHQRFDIAPGETIEMSEESFEQMKAVFRFLKIAKEETKKGLAEAVSETKEEVAKPTTTKENPLAEFRRLKAEAEALGIDVKGLKKDALKASIKKAKGK